MQIASVSGVSVRVVDIYPVAGERALAVCGCVCARLDYCLWMAGERAGAVCVA